MVSASEASGSTLSWRKNVWNVEQEGESVAVHVTVELQFYDRRKARSWSSTFISLKLRLVEPAGCCLLKRVS